MNKSILEVMHETAQDLHEAGAMNEVTMREFDALCLAPIKKYSGNQIKRIRTKNKASQAVFAAYLNTSKSTVQKWEQGLKSPNGPSLKLLNIVDKKGIQALAL
ncbi:MAG: DNA-binding transcriptional regulator [Pseudomonadales bacterium]|nr:DNA-binding transcriptional regulator [Pseudomonadales bacterium]